MSNARSLWSRGDYNLPNEQCIDQFISEMDEPLLVDLVTEIEDEMKETSPALSGFDLFNPECLDKSGKIRKELSQILINHHSYVKSDSFEDQAVSAVPVINLIHAANELQDFMEAYDDG